MMIGIFLPSTALDVSKIKYSLKLIGVFDKEKYKNKVIIFVYNRDIALLKGHVTYLPIKFYNFSIFRKIVKRLKKKLNLRYVADFEIAINKYSIKFGIFTTPSTEIINCSIPYAASFQSLGHRLNPELAETCQRGIWKSREDIYSAVCKNAKLIFIDSEKGKEYLKFYYNPSAEIVVIPHTVPDMLDVDVDEATQKAILNKFHISKDFLFYPAQLWPHKNHVRIFEAIRYLKNKGLDIQLVFTGSSKSIRNEYCVEYMLRRIARDSNMEDNLIITGYLENEEIKTFYINAMALIMPQLIPEPCIPYAEAMGLGCPVIASNIPGIKEQVNGAGILVDPYSIEAIAKGIELLLDKKTRLKYIEKGTENYQSIGGAVTMAFSSIEAMVIELADL